MQSENIQSERTSIRTTPIQYETAKLIEIRNYSGGDAMEPCISLDGKFLFFNDSNASDVMSKIYFAKRVSDGVFECEGPLPGIESKSESESKSKNMAPSIDRDGNFYFTSLRSFEKDHRSIYVGKFADGKVANVRAVDMDIAAPTGPGQINMDCGISPDGQTLVVSQAQFSPGVPVPLFSNLAVCKKSSDGSFKTIGESSAFAKATGGYSYAPAITSDNKNIYYTTAKPLAKTVETEVISVSPDFKVVSTPVCVSAVTGFAEAVSVAQNQSEIFFHKKTGERYCIFHAKKTLRRQSE